MYAIAKSSLGHEFISYDNLSMSHIYTHTNGHTHTHTRTHTHTPIHIHTLTNIDERYLLHFCHETKRNVQILSLVDVHTRFLLVPTQVHNMKRLLHISRGWTINATAQQDPR